jgi:hypothetical protein
MMNRHCSRLTSVVFISTWIIIGGCGSTPPSRFYVLSPLQGDHTQAKADEACAAISVGPVELPDYVDRSQIVTRISPNKLSLAEFDQWAEPLKESFSRVLMENLSILLCADPISLYPSRGPTPVDYRVEVEIIRIDGRLGEQATLVARWIILDEKDSTVLFTRKSNLSSPAQGGDYEALVSAQSQTIAALSRDIAEALKTILKQ